MTPDNQISFSSLNSYSTIQEGIIEILQVTKSHLKKYSFNKSWLNKKILKKDEISVPIDLLNNGIINSEYIGDDVQILFEDDNIMAIDKPSNVHSHPLKYLDKNNCLSFLRSSRNSQILKINSKFYDRGLLYRLDYETSGVLLYIKDENLLKYLRDNFSKVVKKKIYLAIVHGNFKLNGNHHLSLKPHGPKGMKMVMCPEGDGRRGDLTLEALNYNEKENLSLVKIELVTGIRHQIRSQLATLGHPILGDILYGGKKSDRLFLHSYTYSIVFDDFDFTARSQNPSLFDLFFDLDSSL